MDGELVSTSTIRGVLLLGGIATVAYIGFRYWQKVKAAEVVRAPRQLSIPVNEPVRRTPASKGTHGLSALCF